MGNVKHKRNIKILLLVETSRACGRGILYGFVHYSRLNGPWTFYKSPPYYRTKEKMGIELNRLRKLKIDGILFCGEGQHADQIKKIKIPSVMVDVKETIEGLINVIGNCDLIGSMAAEHFLDRGYSNFAYCGYDDIHWSRERRDAFVEHLKRKGFNVNIYKMTTKNNWTLEQNHMAKWLKSLETPLAVMACNDDCAQTITEACKISGLKIPDDVAVLGVDNDELLCLTTDPPLSSISLDFEKAGYEAAAVLHKMITGKKVSDEEKEITLNPVIVKTRQSTDLIAISDDEVSKALAFIRKNYNQPIQVEDVVNSTTKGRRTLEQDFKKHIGTSILVEINKVRIEHICSLLTETTMPISQVAKALNFRDIPHFSRYFQKIKGITPLQYRKKHTVFSMNNILKN